jgi:hypothetical protein
MTGAKTLVSGSLVIWNDLPQGRSKGVVFLGRMPFEVIVMKRFRAFIAVLALSCGALAGVSLGQETQPAMPVPPPAGDAAGTPAAQAPVASKDDDFIPSEEISADEEVTFPVDI